MIVSNASALSYRDFVAVTMAAVLILGGVLGIYGLAVESEKYARRYVKFMQGWLCFELAVLVGGSAVLL